MTIESTVINANRDAIREKATELYRNVLECEGRIQYSLYIWSDGQLETLEDVQGGNAWLKPNDCETRELIFVCNIEAPNFRASDLFEKKPSSDEEAEEWTEIIIDDMVQDYEAAFDDLLDNGIYEYEEAERYFEGY